MSAPTATRRGTTNRNARGSTYDRAARRAYLLNTYGDGVSVRCYRFDACGAVLTAETLTVDRITPGRDGGRYTRDNIRPACGPCNSETGGALATRTRSQIGRASRDKGIAFEKATARALRPHWPEARRSRDNGSATTADTGDLAGTHDVLFWSLKDAKRHSIETWWAEAVEKAGPGRMPLLVVKRAGYADPLRSWCWLRLGDLVHLTDGAGYLGDLVRLELGTVVFLLAAKGLAQLLAEVGEWQ